MTIACVLAFGGNFAASETCFHEAIAELQQAGIRNLKFADPIRSSPMGAEAGGEFVNSAGTFQTEQSPTELLQTIHAIEESMGRQRSVHWGPRPLDIDVIFYGDKIIDSNQIVIPHPCVWYRSFVLRPLAHIAPDWIHPVLKESVQHLKNRLERRPLTIKLRSDHPAIAPEKLEAACVDHRSHFDFRMDDPADEDSNRDSNQDSNRDSNRDTDQPLFARIVIDVAAATERRQPELETDRTIRCRLPPTDGVQEVRQFLTDFEAAVLG